MSKYDKLQYDYVKRLIGEGIFKDDFEKNCRVAGADLHQVLCGFRQDTYRIFETEFQGRTYYATKAKYMQINGISDKIICNDDSLKILVCADTHFGSIKDNKHILFNVYNFCVINNIHHIIIVGDVVEGNDYYIPHKTDDQLQYSLSPENQLKYLSECIPYDSGITIHFLAANHDLFSSTGFANDVMFQFINAYNRKDIAIVGYDFAELPINDSSIYLNHHALDNINRVDLSYSTNLVVSGHSHMAEINVLNNDPIIIEKKVVSLSNIKHGEESSNNYTGFTVLEITFNKGDFDKFYLKDYKYNSPSEPPICYGEGMRILTRRLTK